MHKVFITGMFRSGTTLLEKILTNHEDGFIASQPFPLLYIKLKEIFNRKQGLPSNPYAINPNFLSSFNSNLFTSFLQEHTITHDLITEYLSEMQEYSGCLTPEIINLADKFTENRLVGLYRQICRLSLKNKAYSTIRFLGAKEILGEDYIGYFLNNNVKVILIIRDPRDIIVSSNFSTKKGYVGKKRPIIYILRMWRKSVAHVINFKDNPNFLAIHYEKIINEPIDTLKLITDFLKVSAFSKTVFTDGLKNQDGETWKGNSSFGDKKIIDSSSIGRYTKALKKSMIGYIEAICRPELNYLGYTTMTEFQESNIRSFVESKDNIHEAFSKFSINQGTVASDEQARIKALYQERISAKNKEKLFLFEKAYDILKAWLP